MKRLHVHVAVDDLTRSIGFYSTLFGVPPTRIEADYAKWQLEDPRVNFAISARGAPAGLDHLGLQVDSAEELGAVSAALTGAGETLLDQGATTCCYARSDKAWVIDPQGIAWETFLTLGRETHYGEGARLTPAPTPVAACCGPNRNAS